MTCGTLHCRLAQIRVRDGPNEMPTFPRACDYIPKPDGIEARNGERQNCDIRPALPHKSHR